MKVKFAELHSPLFHGGKNHGQKLFSKNGLELEYHPSLKELEVKYRGESTFLPCTSIHNYTPGDLDVTKEIKNEHQAHDVRKVGTAQVSGPHDHVFQGPAAGKVRNK